jgi:hypothetical protein
VTAEPAVRNGCRPDAERAGKRLDTARRLQLITNHVKGRDGPPGRPFLSARPAVAPTKSMSGRVLPNYRYGVGRGCGVGRGLGNGVGLGVAIGVGVGVGVTVGVAVGVGVGVGVG